MPALKEFAPEDRPNSTVVFWSFRLMAGLGMLMLLLGVLACGCAAATGCTTRGRFCVLPCDGPSGLIAILAGWVTTEVGRQPGSVWRSAHRRGGFRPAIRICRSVC